MHRRSAIRFVLASAVLCAVGALLAPAADAQQAFQRFLPFLIDLNGWTGEKPDGMAMEVPGTNMITATREYRRGDAQLSVQIVTGPAAQGAAAATQTNVNIETGDAHMRTATVDGLPVASSYSVKDRSGIILVALSANAMFSMSFKGVAEDEALSIAKQFDWKSIQASVPK